MATDPQNRSGREIGPSSSTTGHVPSGAFKKALSAADNAFLRKVIEVFRAEVRSLQPDQRRRS